MKTSPTLILLATVALSSALSSSAVEAQIRLDERYTQELEYRLLGPFRGGRTVGAVGIPDQPNVFFVGVNNGGVWKSDDYGRTWHPIFDQAATGSVGDLAVSPSDPDVIYVGSGEGLHRPDLSVGDGIFRSNDGGQTWSHVGLTDVQQVGRLVVHPTDPQTVLVAALGHPYGPNEQRGVFRTRDGGESWERVLYVDLNTGAIQVELDPTDPDVVYACLWDHREGPWENSSFSGPNSGLFKSQDGGSTWTRKEEGLPSAEQGLGRIGLGVSPSDPSRLYATVDAREQGGIYRSDDAGASWQLVSIDPRLWGRGGDFGEIRVHPDKPDTVFVGNIASYRSDDGGESWTSIKGAPGGDDYHRIWINPKHPDIMLFATDQGATVTVNGARTWSSWYNQPTAQLYHVTTDDQFPYWIYGGQQESGAVAISSRGNGGQISFRDWIGVGADEYAYVAPDPLDPNIVYGGRVIRFDKRTGQSQNVAPETLRSGDYRTLRTMPLLFHPAEPRMLLYATNVLWKTLDGAQSWEIISPDLSYEQPEVPESIGDYATQALQSMPRRGVIYALGPSPLDVNSIWAGTDDGRVFLTTDGGENWQNVTPPELRAWDKISQIEASHFDTASAYIAVNAIRRDDQRPHIYRTHDSGVTWERVVTGLEDFELANALTSGSGPINVVREDPEISGLLFAGSERQVFYSTSDGERWHSLRLNMPATSIRDLVIHDDDLVVGTHGRSIWILDNITPLRQTVDAVASSKSFLFKPADAIRVRHNMFSDTPLPPEEPAGENPPEGAVLDYVLPTAVERVSLEITTPEGLPIRRYSTEASVGPTNDLNPDLLAHPTYWIRPERRLGTTVGHHRFVWDLRHEPPAGAERSLSIAAVEHDTPSSPRGPFVIPGVYVVTLTAGEETQSRRITVGLDPRVEIEAQDLRLQNQLSMRAYRGYGKAQAMRSEIDRRLESGSDAPSQRLLAQLLILRGEGAPERKDILYESIYATDVELETLVGLQNKFLFLLELLQSADARPTDQAMRALDSLEATLNRLEERFQELSGAPQIGGETPAAPPPG